LIGQLGKWAAKSPLHDPTLPISHVAVMMSLQTMVEPECARDLEAELEFRFGEICYAASLADGRLHVVRKPNDACNVRFSATPAGLAAVIYGGAPLETIDVEGDISLARRFVTLFPLPPKLVRD
jgi:hypothetical protein